MNKHITTTLCFLIVALFVMGAIAEDNDLESDVWVAVSLFDGRKSKAVEYYGAMNQKVFEAITGNAVTNGFFKLDHTSWMDDEGFMLMRESKCSGRLRGYSGQTHFLVNAVTRIVVLEPDYVENTLLPRLKEKTEE